MQVLNVPKAMIVLVALICITVLMVTDSIDESTGAGLIGSIVGYAIGNGIAAKRGDPVEPIIGSRYNDKRGGVYVMEQPQHETNQLDWTPPPPPAA